MPSFWQQAASAVIAILVVSLVPFSSVAADTKPYFRTQDGGPFVGGWFKSGASCEGGNYQRPIFGPFGNQYTGAIMSWANGNRTDSAGSNLDAFATGVIEGNGGPEYGFYTGLSGTSALSFANINSLSASNFWGGIFEGAVAANAHCIPDYFSTKRGSTPLTAAGNFGGRVIPVGPPQLVFINGDVNITGNITYAAHDATNIPKFALVVRGDIRIGSGVTRLDGWYIAQPDSGGNGGVIWTCNNGTSTVNSSFIRSSCNSKLTVNGALTAKQVNLTRINGNLSGDSAEAVNFTPEMVIGGPFFEGPPGSNSTGAIQSLISLPPVF